MPGPRKPHPRGRTQALGQRTPRAVKDQVMATKKTPTTGTPATAPRQPVRQSITLEMAIARAPHAALAANLSRTFGLEEPDYQAIREIHEECIGRAANALKEPLDVQTNPKAMQIHLQRIVGAFVSSAYGAAMFYGNKVSDARRETMASENDHRDEDRTGVAGFESKAERARLFAARMGLQAYALLAAAEGAVSAYEHVTGETWKPYEGQPPSPAPVARQSAAAEMAAFGD